MKINVNVTLDLDPETWSLIYGVEGASDIRADMKEHAYQSLIEHYLELGVLNS